MSFRAEPLTFEPGDKVCIAGWGTAATVHVHHTVHHVTATQVVSLSGKGFERRHRLVDGKSVGTGGYGGTTIAATCQRPKTSKQ